MADSTCVMDEDTNTENNSLKRAVEDSDCLAEEGPNKKLKISESEKQLSEDGSHQKSHLLPRKKKCALLVSYCGAGYNGMQINPGVRTIEEELVNSLHKAEAITDDGKECMGKMSFQRCARTDKGVSAARQVMVPMGSLLPAINKNLPPEIRVIGMKRTTRGFDAKTNCSARTYEYLTPTYAFAKDYQTSSSYRVTAEKIQEVNGILENFLGTHNYHNFTSGKRFNDASAKRYIMKFQCEKPFEKDGREFIVISVKGQSFMLHQIRKMIGLAVAVVRGVAPLSTIELARQEKKVDIPKTPAVGLVLDKVHFEGYNRRYGSDGIHQTLEWDEYEETIQQFKDEFIYKHIINTEVKDHTMLKWLRTLADHTYNHERMEEIQTKSVKDTNKEQTTTEEVTSNLSLNTEGNCDAELAMDRELNEQQDKAGGIGGIQRSILGGESGEFNNPEGCHEVKQFMDHEVNEQPSKGEERGDLQQSLVGGESG